MNYKTVSPAEQIAALMSRIYSRGMTTTSGGNLSYRDESGRVWVSPARFDKAELKPEDIVCIMQDGSVVGRNQPTSEYKFHLEAMRANPKIRSVLHAHSTALMSYSFLHKAPDMRVLPFLQQSCGPISVAKYALAGSEELSYRVYEEFRKGNNAAILENHGIVVGGSSLIDAYIRFEQIEYCAEMLISSHRIGYQGVLPEYTPEDTLKIARELQERDFDFCSPEECIARSRVAKIGRRLYQQKLCLSTGGSFSIRIGEDSFVISPAGVDRKYLSGEETVRVSNGYRERGKIPDASVELHRCIYRRHPEINYIIMADAQNCLAFSLVNKNMDCTVVPEGYLLLRQVPQLPCGIWTTDPESVAEQLSDNSPVLLFSNDCLLVTGKDWFDSYDRVEVADFNAKSIMDAETVDAMKPLNKEELDEFEKAFF